MLMIFFIMLLELYPPPRNILSFPTRRSSDLGAKADPLYTQLVLAGGDTGDRRPTIGARKATEVRDRKSTRLNSSHVAISYAVFCLIKKIPSLFKLTI